MLGRISAEDPEARTNIAVLEAIVLNRLGGANAAAVPRLTERARVILGEHREITAQGFLSKAGATSWDETLATAIGHGLT